MNDITSAIRTYLVTGGAGFIGSHFVRTLVSQGHRVHVLDKLTYAGNIKNLQDLIESGQVVFFHGDICDPKISRLAMESTDLVVNFAAESHVDRSILDSAEFIKTNVLGVENLLSLALKLGISQFIQISTDEVYGSIEVGTWTEDSPLMPNSPYSASKASADLLALSFFKTHGLDVRITRCCNNFGPMQMPEKFIPNLITKMLRQENLPIYGDGKNVREWIHVDDHCFGINLVINEGKPGEVYNIGSSFELENIEVAKLLLSLFGSNLDRLEYVKDRKGHDFRYSIDSSKIKSLGFSYNKNFSDELRGVIEWYRDHDEYWRVKA